MEWVILVRRLYIGQCRVSADKFNILLGINKIMKVSEKSSINIPLAS